MTARLGFVGAQKLLKTATGRVQDVRLMASSTLDPLIAYFRAHALLAGIDAHVDTLPFGTLGQALRAPAPPAAEIFLLAPWDFVAQLDWRSGIPETAPTLEACLAEAEETLRLLAARPRAGFVFLPAPSKPLFADTTLDRRLTQSLLAYASGIGARLLAESDFALASYLDSGMALAGGALEDAGIAAAAELIRLCAPPPEPAKLLVTDLDNTLWGGIVGEDGVDGLAWRPEGAGWRHYHYQALLKRLKGEGVLLAAVSRNNPEDAAAPFRAGGMILAEDDLIAILASWQAKSAQIRALAERLNLGQDAVVFVDDNPVELAEIKGELPALRPMAFPADEAALPAFLSALSAQFSRPLITDEDRKRTDLYRQRLEGMAPVGATGADLTSFLKGLGMRLRLRERTTGERARALQLINKTNQFNLNGRRLSEDELAAMLAAGGRLFTGELSDRTGSHGEVLALLADRDGMVESFVMSCRVFLRRAEHAFLAALASRGVTLSGMRHAATEKNEPFRTFMADPAFAGDRFDAGAFRAAHAEDCALFTLSWED